MAASLPVRGRTAAGQGFPVPPERMAAVRRGRPLKRWHYVGAYGDEVSVCVAEVRIGPVPQRFWAVAVPGELLGEHTTLARGGISVAGSRVRVRGKGVSIALDIDDSGVEPVEVLSPHGRSYIWTRKLAGVGIRGCVEVAGRTFDLDCAGMVDESAGYHARRTAWRWSAGVGRTAAGQGVAWNLVAGVHDALVASERTIWLDGRAHEVSPAAFAEDLSWVAFDGGEQLLFQPWAERAAHTNLVVARSRYRQPFGEFSGTLPGGIELAHGRGVMEWHDVIW